MKLSFLCAATGALFVFPGCATAARILGQRDTLVIEVLSEERRPISGVKIEVLGWIEHFWAMRSREKLADGISDADGRLSVSVPVHVGYLVQVGDFMPVRPQWAGRLSIERKELPSSYVVQVLLRWTGSGPPPLRDAKKPNKAPEPTTMAVTPHAISRISEMKSQTPNRHAARGAPAMVVAHL